MKPARLALLGLLLSGCAFLDPDPPPRVPPKPPRPTDVRKPSSTFALELITRRQVAGLTMKVFNTGTVRTRGEVVSSIKSWHAKVRLPVPAFLISHPKEGLVLFDTGLSPDEARRPKRGDFAELIAPGGLRYSARKGQDVVSRLRASGVDPAAVRWVVLSHLHPDHAGMIDAFSSATVVVSRAEWDWQTRAEIPAESRIMDWRALEKSVPLWLVDLSSAPAFGAFDHAMDLFKDGSLFLIPTVGHTPGGLALWANLDEGAALLAGDACLVVDTCLDMALPSYAMMRDLPAYWRVMHQVRAMAESVPRLLVLPGHDLAPLSIARRRDVILVE